MALHWDEERVVKSGSWEWWLLVLTLSLVFWGVVMAALWVVGS